jgi:translation elongation factor EF-Tu-like GTPase
VTIGDLTLRDVDKPFLMHVEDYILYGLELLQPEVLKPNCKRCDEVQSIGLVMKQENGCNRVEMFVKFWIKEGWRYTVVCF